MLTHRNVRVYPLYGCEARLCLRAEADRVLEDATELRCVGQRQPGKRCLHLTTQRHRQQRGDRGHGNWRSHQWTHKVKKQQANYFGGSIEMKSAKVITWSHHYRQKLNMHTQINENK